jgi:hypothetical protein
MVADTLVYSGLLLTLLAATACGAQNGSLLPADMLVRRNVFRGATEFPIAEARAFQYGTVHVDGPEGGMLYRFETDAQGLDWLVREWSLHPIQPDTGPSLPPVDEAPGWWRSAGRASGTPLGADSTDASGGVRSVLLVRDPAASVAYWREHYRAAPRGPRP